MYHRVGHPTKKEWANRSAGCDFPLLKHDGDGSALMQTGQSLGHPMCHINSKLAIQGRPIPSMWNRELLHQSRFWPVLACFSRDLTPLQRTSASQLGFICLGTSVPITKEYRSPKSAVPSASSFIYMHSRGQIWRSATMPKGNHNKAVKSQTQNKQEAVTSQEQGNHMPVTPAAAPQPKSRDLYSTVPLARQQEIQNGQGG